MTTFTNGKAQVSPVELIKNLRILRERGSHSLEELAGSVGKSKGWLSRVERGMIDPYVSDIFTMYRYMGYEVVISFKLLDC